MLYTTDGQLYIAFILFLTSVILCFSVFLANFFIKKIKYNKIKFVCNFVFDFVVVLIFTLVFIILCSSLNYGIVRLYCLISYILPIVILLMILKRQKIKKLSLK